MKDDIYIYIILYSIAFRYIIPFLICKTKAQMQGSPHVKFHGQSIVLMVESCWVESLLLMVADPNSIPIKAKHHWRAAPDSTDRWEAETGHQKNRGFFESWVKLQCNTATSLMKMGYPMLSPISMDYHGLSLSSLSHSNCHFQRYSSFRHPCSEGFKDRSRSDVWGLDNNSGETIGLGNAKEISRREIRGK